MIATNNKIDLVLNQHGKKGIQMMCEYYSQLSQFILETIWRRKRVRLNDLLESASRELLPASYNNLSWNVLQVKLDLEARGFITMDTASRFQRLPFIRLTRKGEKAIRDKHTIGTKHFYLLLMTEEF